MQNKLHPPAKLLVACWKSERKHHSPKGGLVKYSWVTLRITVDISQSRPKTDSPPFQMAIVLMHIKHGVKVAGVWQSSSENNKLPSMLLWWIRMSNMRDSHWRFFMALSLHSWATLYFASSCSGWQRAADTMQPIQTLDVGFKRVCSSFKEYLKQNSTKQICT